MIRAQMVLSFNEAATRTHEYPSEQSLWDVSDTRHDGELGVDYDDDGSSYYGMFNDLQCCIELAYGFM